MPPPGTRIVAGGWWPTDYDGAPLVSFDANLARGWNVGIGDLIRVSVLGRDIDLRIASLRDIAWQSLSLNFTLVASPGLLQHAPHTHIATVRVVGPQQGGLLRAVTDALPNVTGIRVEDVLAAVAALLDQVAAALVATGSLTLIAGAMVLVGAVAAGQRRRTQEAVILKVLGATRRQIRAAWMVEFGALGLAAGRDRRPGGNARQLRRGPLHHALRLGVPAGHPGGDADCLPRHDADVRLYWHRDRAAGQGGSDAAERVRAGEHRNGLPSFHYYLGLNRPGRSPN